jgi:potassium-transporting ATPase potassium-binding subunit
VTLAGWGQAALLVVCLTALTPLLGGYLQRVFDGDPPTFARPLAPVARGLCALVAGRDPVSQDWRRYATSVVLLGAVSWLALFVVLRTQSIQPFNPQGFSAPPWDLSFNTAASFVSNSSWQYYRGETTLSAFSQMAGIGVQSFLSGATGLAVGIAVARGFASRSGQQLGNFWVDLVRGLVFVLVPLAAIGALLLVSAGAVQTLAGHVTYATVAGASQTLALGPVASQKAIMLLGSEGGGFYGVNSAMPFENPSGLTNFVAALAIVAIPAALTNAYGRIVGNRRQGWVLFAVMAVMFAGAAAVAYTAESRPTPAMRAAALHGGNLEGKEQRFGVADSALTAVAGTTVSSGAVNAALDSFSGLGGSIPLAGMMTGEVVFGGVGSGLYGMLLMVLLAVFVAGLMVGRTPEYLGKRIEAREIKLVVIGAIGVPLIVLVTTAWAIGSSSGMRSIFNAGPQGFSETLAAYTSQANNNGAGFAGYSGFVQPHPPGNAGATGIAFADLLGGSSMLIGRYLPMLAALAIAGSLAGKREIVAGGGTMRTDTAVFALLLVMTITIVALLTFVPALMLGPLVQALTDRVL